MKSILSFNFKTKLNELKCKKKMSSKNQIKHKKNQKKKSFELCHKTENVISAAVMIELL